MFPPCVFASSTLTHCQDTEPWAGAFCCNCELHDERITIRLPNPGRAFGPPYTQDKGQILRDELVEKVGKWERVNSPKRKAAQQRFTAVLEERIKKIIADVEADGEAVDVAVMAEDIWCSSQWSAGDLPTYLSIYLTIPFPSLFLLAVIT